jgi:hypothetical protein
METTMGSASVTIELQSNRICFEVRVGSTLRKLSQRVGTEDSSEAHSTKSSNADAECLYESLSPEIADRLREGFGN